MSITKANIKEVLKRYMKQNDLGYMDISASLSMDRSKVIMVITEEEEDADEIFYSQN